jgi:hypothetical protein
VASGKGSMMSALIESCEVFTPFNEQQKKAASMIVCGNAQGETHEEQVAWAEDMMGMLGLLPGQEDEEYLTGPHGNVNDHV